MNSLKTCRSRLRWEERALIWILVVAGVLLALILIAAATIDEARSNISANLPKPVIIDLNN